jgi:hypothetical protein
MSQGAGRTPVNGRNHVWYRPSSISFYFLVLHRDESAGWRLDTADSGDDR